VTIPCEYTLAEKPCIDALVDLGYNWLPPSQHDIARDGQNHVILRDILIQAVQDINNVSEEVARSVYHELLAVSYNEQWISILRGNYSRTVPGEDTKKTITIIDLLHPENNTYTVTNQLHVRSQHSRRPDVVVYVNGIPLVVIEAKSPLSFKDKTGEAFDQIKQYEQDIPRLFYSNAFNIITDGVSLLFGATGASSEFWGAWKDPWPMQESDFQTGFDKGLYCLLEPSRLMDILAHFMVFEIDKTDNKVIKKICRYQQYRAVNKIVERVIAGKHRRGLIWHTQGSGKSLTMVFATLKLKNHLTIQNSALTSPNVMVLTDRKNLDTQISDTFTDCKLPNPKQIGSIRELRRMVHSNTSGLTLISTIHKFAGSKTPVENSAEWIVLVDECHRTQEKDLGVYLQATFPDARFFGFTGTPIKKNDHDTYRQFGAPGEVYLDRYSIDDAVADGATVPVRYTSRKTEWHLEAARLDVFFDQWFASEPHERLEKIKQRGITIATLAKHTARIELIAYDIWTHYTTHAMPDGFKAQIVGIDREAVILYKQALDNVIAESLEQEGLPHDEARKRAETMSACIYSSNQEDCKPCEDPYIQSIRDELCSQLVKDEDEPAIIEDFKSRDHPLCFLIVCNKLLTGFDAPIESVMYLDSPLKDHSLLQAIARTNRVAGPQKQFGLIVDYIGVTKKLDEALASYREADVKNAMQDQDIDRAKLKAAHAEVMKYVKGIQRGTNNIKAEYDALVQVLGAEDVWFTFRRKAKAFIRAYEALSPDPPVLDYMDDMKWVAGFLSYATMVFEKKEAVDLRTYSAKIRQMLEEHLHVTGLISLIKLRNITDPEFYADFRTENKSNEDLNTAAIRKSTELKKILAQKKEENPLRYGPFSERVLAVLQRFEAGQLSAVDALREYNQIVQDLENEDKAHEKSGLNERTYGVYKILESFIPTSEMVSEVRKGYDSSTSSEKDNFNVIQQLAQEIDMLYTSDQSAPVGWHLKEQLRKELRQEVRKQANHAGLNDLMSISTRIEDYALKNYIKVS
jgi:type I restriction enzyme R subunit